MKETAPTVVTGPQVDTKTATIANGGSLSGAINLGYQRLVALVMPAAWTAAGITFQASPDGVTYTDVYDATGAEYSVTVGASHTVIIPVADLIGMRFLKIRSGTSGTPVNQGAARAITVVMQ